MQGDIEAVINYAPYPDYMSHYQDNNVHSELNT